MDYEYKSFIDNLNSLEGIDIFQKEMEPTTWVFFSCESDHSIALLTALVEEIADDKICKMMNLTHPINEDKPAYQLVFHQDVDRLLKLFSSRIKMFVEKNKVVAYDEYGVPDLSLVTIKQIAKELKNRKNLTFAMVWMEENIKDNIAIEGNGNPTHLVGLLARGLHMAIEWSDRYLKFNKQDKDKDDN